MAQFWTDFSEYTDGVQPSDWTERRDTTIGTAVVTATGAPHAAKALKITKTANSNDYAISWNAVGTPTGDVELLWRAYFTSTGTTAGGADQGVIHGSGGAGTYNGYAAQTNGTGGSTVTHVSRYTNGSQNILDTPASNVATAVNAWRWCRAQRVGTTIRARWWAEGATEPGTWPVSATDATYSTGWVGLCVVHNAFTGWFSQFSVGTGGDPAPATAPAAPSGDNGGFFF